MIERLRVLYSGGVVAYILAVTVGILARDYVRERQRVAGIVADTVADMNARADDIRVRARHMIESENDARYDAVLWGDTDG